MQDVLYIQVYIFPSTIGASISTEPPFFFCCFFPGVISYAVISNDENHPPIIISFHFSSVQKHEETISSSSSSSCSVFPRKINFQVRFGWAKNSICKKPSSTLLARMAMTEERTDGSLWLFSFSFSFSFFPPAIDPVGWMQILRIK